MRLFEKKNEPFFFYFVYFCGAHVRNKSSRCYAEVQLFYSERIQRVHPLSVLVHYVNTWVTVPVWVLWSKQSTVAGSQEWSLHKGQRAVLRPGRSSGTNEDRLIKSDSNWMILVVNTKNKNNKENLANFWQQLGRVLGKMSNPFCNGIKESNWVKTASWTTASSAWHSATSSVTGTASVIAVFALK